jgi:hypothetical protein
VQQLTQELARKDEELKAMQDEAAAVAVAAAETERFRVSGLGLRFRVPGFRVAGAETAAHILKSTLYSGFRR